MNRLGVVGCGVMGAGIAEIGAKGGCDVIVVDAFPEQLTSPLVNQYLEAKAKHLL